MALWRRFELSECFLILSVSCCWKSCWSINDTNERLLHWKSELSVLISATRGVIIVNNWLCLSGCLSHPFRSILLFCFSMESSRFWPSVLHVALYKTLFFDFWFKPLTPKISYGTCVMEARQPVHTHRLAWGCTARWWRHNLTSIMDEYGTPYMP